MCGSMFAAGQGLVGLQFSSSSGYQCGCSDTFAPTSVAWNKVATCGSLHVVLRLGEYVAFCVHHVPMPGCAHLAFVTNPVDGRQYMQ